MRRSHNTNTLVIITNPLKGLYDDRWDDDILHYTGMGQTGNQRLNNQNRTLAEMHQNGVSVHLFEVFQPTRYKHLGPVDLVQDSYQDEQYDVNDNLRKVWVFPIKCLNSSADQAVSIDEVVDRQNKRYKRFQSLSEDKLADLAKKHSGKPSRRTTSSQTYERNPAVVEYAKRCANGKCELCGKPAPFKDKSGVPFLEVHHIVWLSRNGDDTVSNVAAMCPNCHRKMHALNKKADQRILLEIATEH